MNRWLPEGRGVGEGNKQMRGIKRKKGFPGGSASKESPCSVGDLGPTPVVGRSPGDGNGNSLQYSCLENSLDSIVHGVAKSRT